MTTLTEKLDQNLYPGFGCNWDDHLFRERIFQHLTPQRQSSLISGQARASSSK